MSRAGRRTPSDSAGRRRRRRRDTCPSVVANDVMRARSLLRQYGQVSGSNFQRSAHRPQIRCRSAAGVMTARSGSPPHSAQCECVQLDKLRALLQHLRASRQKRTHRQREHLAQRRVIGQIGPAVHRGRNGRHGELALGCRSIPASDDRQELHVAAERLHLLEVRVVRARRSGAGRRRSGAPSAAGPSDRAGCLRSEGAGRASAW